MTEQMESKSDAIADEHTPRSRPVWIIIALAILAAVILFLILAEDTADVEKTGTKPPTQLVSVEMVTDQNATVEIRSFAEVRPRWSVELRAAVSGRIIKVHDSALAGERVKAGTLLILIEDSRYTAELAAAELALKEARLSLWRAKNDVHVARKSFERTGTKPPNDLALKLPQLEIAESLVASAKARKSAAKQQLADTKIMVPYSSYVTERFVSPGQAVNPGDPLVKLVDNTTYELTVQLSRSNWELLKRPITGLLAKIMNDEGDIIAYAKVRRGGGFLDEKTRLYKVFLEINGEASQSVLSGDFVRVLLPGITVSSALDIPASALTKEGYVWHLDDKDHLKRISPHILFRRDDRIIIKAPEGKTALRVARTPLVSFLPGQKVRARDGEN